MRRHLNLSLSFSAIRKLTQMIFLFHPSFICQNKTIHEHDTANDLRDETIPQHQLDTANDLIEDITPEDADLMVPIQYLNTSQAETPLTQHLNEAETPPNHGHLSQAEAPNDVTVRWHNINLISQYRKIWLQTMEGNHFAHRCN